MGPVQGADTPSNAFSFRSPRTYTNPMGNTPVLYMRREIEPEPELDRKKQFARRANVSVRTVDNWLADGRIPYLKIGRTVLIPWGDALSTLNRKYRLEAHGETSTPAVKSEVAK